VVLLKSRAGATKGIGLTPGRPILSGAFSSAATALCLPRRSLAKAGRRFACVQNAPAVRGGYS